VDDLSEILNYLGSNDFICLAKTVRSVDITTGFTPANMTLPLDQICADNQGRIIELPVPCIARM
jgi:hypothetical protein